MCICNSPHMPHFSLQPGLACGTDSCLLTHAVNCCVTAAVGRGARAAPQDAHGPHPRTGEIGVQPACSCSTRGFTQQILSSPGIHSAYCAATVNWVSACLLPPCVFFISAVGVPPCPPFPLPMPLASPAGPSGSIGRGCLRGSRQRGGQCCSAGWRRQQPGGCIWGSLLLRTTNCISIWLDACKVTALMHMGSRVPVHISPAWSGLQCCCSACLVCVIPLAVVVWLMMGPCSTPANLPHRLVGQAPW
jgi:hypothetical protein